MWSRDSHKNPTNLKIHVSTVRPKVYAEFKENEDSRKAAKKQKIETAKAKGIQTIRELIDKKCSKWTTESVEYKDKLRGVLDWIVASGCPMFQLDLSEFKNMLRTCDSKLQVPGN